MCTESGKQPCLGRSTETMFQIILLTKSAVCVLLCAQSCLTLCDPMDCSPPGSSVHGMLQARMLEWVAFPPPGDLPNPGIELTSPGLQYWQTDSFTSELPGKP